MGEDHMYDFGTAVSLSIEHFWGKGDQTVPVGVHQGCLWQPMLENQRTVSLCKRGVQGRTRPIRDVFRYLR